MPLTPLCQLGPLTCFGCCGHSYKSRKEVLDDIQKNTKESYTYEDLAKFRDRMPADELRPSGVCSNLVFNDESNSKVFCPLHPKRNNNNDLRIGHCDTKYLCMGAKLFDQWPKTVQEKFISFLKSKKPDVFTYSMGMDQDIFLKEFAEREGIILPGEHGRSSAKPELVQIRV